MACGREALVSALSARSRSRLIKPRAPSTPTFVSANAAIALHRAAAGRRERQGGHKGRPYGNPPKMPPAGG